MLILHVTETWQDVSRAIWHNARSSQWAVTNTKHLEGDRSHYMHTIESAALQGRGTPSHVTGHESITKVLPEVHTEHRDCSLLLPRCSLSYVQILKTGQVNTHSWKNAQSPLIFLSMLCFCLFWSNISLYLSFSFVLNSSHSAVATPLIALLLVSRVYTVASSP